METSNTDTNKTISYFKARKLKVYYGYIGKSYKKVPVIRLCGDYLFQIGFCIGDSIEINLEKDKVSITKTYPSEADLGSAEAQPNRNSLE